MNSLHPIPWLTASPEASPPGTLVQAQPEVSQPRQGPILWSFSPPGSAQGRNPALPALVCALITSPQGKPLVWKEMAREEAVPTLKIGPGPVSRAPIPVVEEPGGLLGAEEV